MQIFIKTSTESKQAIEVTPENTVAEVKELVANSPLSIPADNQRLIFSGKVLKDIDTLDSHNIKDGNTIHLVKSQIKVATPSSTNTTTAPTTVPATSGIPSSLPMNAFPNPFASSAVLGGPFSNSGSQPLNTASYGGAPMGVGGMPELDPQMMNMMMNPEIIQRTMQLMQQRPELLNIASSARSM